jgi:lipoprotein-anchoring transpeptidase ErfK/SrfK
MTRRGGIALAIAATVMTGCGAVAVSAPLPAHAPVRPSVLADPTPESGLPHDPLGARVLHDTPLRARPGGPVIAPLSRRTEYGSHTVLAVAGREHPGWVAVHATQAGNGRVGWVAAVNTQLVVEPVTVEVDLSSRALVVRRSGRLLLRAHVAIGAPGTPTPTGTFGVTDVLRPAAGSVYGCCILALTGHQPDLPSGWSGGDRLAVHGTLDESTIGDAVSAGCMHASDRVMRRLLAVVPLGSTVRVRA